MSNAAAACRRSSRGGRLISFTLTLRRTWPRGETPRPQCAFKVSMIEVFCNSHYFTQLAALVIDARAE